MGYSMLVDVTKCIGCEGCRVSCKNWNGRPGSRGSGEVLDSSTYSVVKTSETADIKAGVPGMHFAKVQCMHCLEPACASACACGALKKTAAGPVEHYPDRCIGCRYCMLACPFGVPAFEWATAFPHIRKCSFCTDRIKKGVEPACSKSCASGALLFGRRDELLKTAEDRIKARPGRYIDAVYGKDEAGGTSWLYISDTGFGNLSLREDLDKAKYSDYSMSVLSKTPAVGLGAAALLAGFFFITGRRNGAGRDGGAEK